jgi:hypothetical protein
MKTILTVDKCEELSTHIQEIAKRHHCVMAYNITDNGLAIGGCTWKEGEFSLKTDCGWMLNVNENEKAMTLCNLVDGILFPYGYAVGDPYSDRELHLYKF